MWAAIKKAINSNLAKPLDILLGELYNVHKTDIGNTYNKAYEANDNALKSVQKGQEIVNMMNDTGGKKYTIVRQGIIYTRNRFDYSGGAGVLRDLNWNASSTNSPVIIVDGQVANVSHKISTGSRSKLPFELEFKNSISIMPNNVNDTYYTVQTER